MNSADIIALIIILACMAMGITMGFVRSLAMFLGVLFAFTFASTQAAQGMGHYAGVYLAVVVGATIVGFLIYGATRMQLLDAMEGVFGAILGFLSGWGIAKFLFTLYLVYKPDDAFTMTIQMSMFGMDIYTVAPYLEMMNRTTDLRKPNIN